MKFKLESLFKPIEEQEKVIERISENLLSGVAYQTLLGVTGSGKTFTLANVIERVQRPTLIISHNKTLAAQLYQEFKTFFPKNAVSFFISYYDYYQPESYIPQTDTYIEKDADINEQIDRLRLAATANILTRADTVVVASVSSIYNIGSPTDFLKFGVTLFPGKKIFRRGLIEELIKLQYDRAGFDFKRGTFRIRGECIDVYLADQEAGLRICFDSRGEKIEEISLFEPISSNNISEKIASFTIFPSKHFVSDQYKNEEIFRNINEDLDRRVEELKRNGKLVEAHRLTQKVKYDLEMIREVGYVKGIENYSRYFDGRKPGEPPFTLLDYFNTTYGNKWLLIVDESHITFPQIRGMYNGDLSRKKTLIEYGFRLPSALDNRPLKFSEFLRKIPNFIASSATPSKWEISMSGKNVIELLVRPTGIPDPEVTVRPVRGQIEDVVREVKKQVQKSQRTLITTLTKRTAEDVAEYLSERGINVHYLHSDIDAIERTDILEKLRAGDYDVLVGINLLREGLDLPEVSLVAILDADKEGFLRSDVTLIQTMGRAARHSEGRVIMYADKITESMKRAIDEVKRRRRYQLEYNKRFGIVPKSIVKPLRGGIVIDATYGDKLFTDSSQTFFQKLKDIDIDGLTPMEKKKIIGNLRKEMKIAAQNLDFELAIEIRDSIKRLEDVA
jgi:excinuclease ABC subunit B